jgi:iron(III) transport system permease protein
MTTVLSDREPSASAKAAAPRRRRGDMGVRGLIAVAALVVAVGSVVPLIAVLTTAFAPDALPRYTEFFTSWIDLAVLRNTLVLGALVGLCGTALGFLFAFVQTRLDVRGKKILHVIALIPIVSPPSRSPPPRSCCTAGAASSATACSAWSTTSTAWTGSCSCCRSSLWRTWDCSA